jgi:nitrile hydratase
MAMKNPETIPAIETRAHALKTVLQEQGLFSDEMLKGMHDLWDAWIPENGARVVARAWTDDAFRSRLLDNAAAACAEFGIPGVESGHLVALENTPTLQNVIVCTLCSCTAWPVLGLPPDWYKSFEYRSRVVREARQVLREMGLILDDDVRIQVWDTTADTRYMVLPFRPAGTEGWTLEQLAAIVTKDCLIGVARPQGGD